jgi:hypothetical protein
MFTAFAPLVFFLFLFPLRYFLSLPFAGDLFIYLVFGLCNESVYCRNWPVD